MYMPWVRAIVAAYKQSGVLQRVVSGAMFLSPMLSLTPLELPQKYVASGLAQPHGAIS